MSGNGKTKSTKRKPTSYADMTRRQRETFARPAKRGNRATGTDAAHKQSHELQTGFLASKPGPKVQNRAEIKKTATMTSSSQNLRMKSAKGNRSTDRLNDAAILQAQRTGDRLNPAAAKRAVQAYKGGSVDPSVAGKDGAWTTSAIGEMRANTGKPGQPPKVKNLARQK